MTAQPIDASPETMRIMPSYTVDDLFTLPESNDLYQVFGGSLVMSPAPAPLHQIVADELRTLLSPLVKPHGARAVTTIAVRVTDEDGPVPDITIVDAAQLRGLTGAVPLGAAFTAVEVVSPSSAGAAGQEQTFPLAVGADTWIDVVLDPAHLDTL